MGCSWYRHIVARYGVRNSIPHGFFGTLFECREAFQESLAITGLWHVRLHASLVRL